MAVQVHQSSDGLEDLGKEFYCYFISVRSMIFACLKMAKVNHLK